MTVKLLTEAKTRDSLKIGQKLRNLRKSRGLTQFQVSSTLLLSRMHYLRLEKGEMIPSAMHLYMLAKIFGVSMEWFFEGDSNVPPPEVRSQSDFGADQDTVTELFQVMREIPLIRYSILKDFMEMKEEHKDLINSTREKYKEYSETAMKHQSPDQGK